MGGRLLASLLLFCLSSVALSQEGAASNPVPTQPPGAPLHVGTPSSDSQASAPATTLRKEVRLVVVDAVVLDKKGAPVTGLKAGDFVLKEDGVAQTLTSVEEHKGDEHGPVANESAAPDGTISASNKPLNSPAVWNVLLVDQFKTTSADQANMLRQLGPVCEATTGGPAGGSGRNVEPGQAAGSVCGRCGCDCTVSGQERTASERHPGAA
jgi:hypothetical protein